MSKSMLNDFAAVHSFWVVLFLFSRRPRPVANSTILLAAVCTQTGILILGWLLSEPERILDVVFRDGSAGSLLGVAL